MQSFTFGSPEFMKALSSQKEKSGENYSISLNDVDFQILTVVLRDIALYGEISKKTRDSVVRISETNDNSVELLDNDVELIEDWAWATLSCIGETLGVEGI